MEYPDETGRNINTTEETDLNILFIPKTTTTKKRIKETVMVTVTVTMRTSTKKKIF